MTTPLCHSMDVDAVLKELKVDPLKGLASEEAANRLGQYGPNELLHEEKASPWTLFFNQFKNILIVILIVATMLSAFVGEYVDAVIILVIMVFCAVLGFVQEYRAERALDALKSMLRQRYACCGTARNRKSHRSELVAGDILILEAGDKIPADARLIENHSLKCDEAPLTGESLPVAKEIVPMPQEALVADRRK